MPIQIQVRRDTAANWTSVNPILAEGEIGYETDTSKGKVGNGSTAWSSLSYTIWPNALTNPATTTGDTIYASSGSTLSRLAIGTAGQALTVNTGATAPAWSTLTLENLPGAWTKKAVRAATTTNIATLAGGAPSTLDGVSLALNDRILVKNQSTASQNGIYYVSTLGTGANGTWTRVLDADTADELAGATVSVDSGSTQAGQIWTTSFKPTDTVGSTSMTWYKLIDTSQVNTNVATWLATPSSANLLSAMSDETGTGLLVFGTSPTLTTPLIANSSGTAASGLIDYNGDVFTATTSNTGAGKGLLQAPYIVVSNANSSATTSTTAVSIFQSGSRTTPLEAGKAYYFRANLYGTSTWTSGNANIQLVPTWSQTQQNYRYNVTYTASAGTAGYASQTSGTTTATPTQNSPSITATTNFIMVVEGTFLANATTGGTFELQARMSTTGSSTVFNTGSILQVQKIGTSVNGEIAGVWG